MCFRAGTKSFETLVAGQFYPRPLFHKFPSIMKAGNYETVDGIIVSYHPTLMCLMER